MLSLSDNELRSLVEAARELPVDRRSDFLQLIEKYKKKCDIPNVNIPFKNLRLPCQFALRELSRHAAGPSN